MAEAMDIDPTDDNFNMVRLISYYTEKIIML